MVAILLFVASVTFMVLAVITSASVEPTQTVTCLDPDSVPESLDFYDWQDGAKWPIAPPRVCVHRKEDPRLVQKLGAALACAVTAFLLALIGAIVR